MCLLSAGRFGDPMRLQRNFMGILATFQVIFPKGHLFSSKKVLYATWIARIAIVLDWAPPWCFLRWGNPWIGRLGSWGISPNPGTQSEQGTNCMKPMVAGLVVMQEGASKNTEVSDLVRENIWMRWIVGSPVCARNYIKSLAEWSKITFACRWNNDLLMRLFIPERGISHILRNSILLYILGDDKSLVLLFWTSLNHRIFSKRKQGFHAIAALSSWEWDQC